MVLLITKDVDKYLLVVLVFLIAGMGIAIVQVPPIITMFYSMLAGAIGIIIYSSLKSRKQRQEENRKRRSKK